VSRRLIGLVVLVAALIGSVAAGLHPAPGRPIRAVGAAAPQVGECLRDPNQESLEAHQERVESGPADSTTGTGSPWVDCAGPHHGEVAGVRYRSDDGVVDIGDDTCRTESLLYAGFQQRGSRFVLAGDDPTDPVEWNYALGLDRFWIWQFPTLPRSASDWAACVASSANPAQDVGLLANAYRGGILPVGFGTCWDSRDLTAATQPLSCYLPHQAELIASGSVMLPDATPPVSLQGSCSRQAAKVIGRADPTAGGELTEQVLTTESDSAGAAKQVVCFVVPAQPRRLIGTLVGLRDSPIQFIE